MAWLLVVLFASMGIIFYGVTAWLTEAYIERGWSEEGAAALFAVFNLTPLLTALPVTWLADRIGSRRRYLSLGSLGMLIGLLGVVLLPEAGFLWVSMMGAANGVLFALVLTLPIDVADRPAQVGAVAGMMLGIGYTTSAISPFLLGGVRDATGTFTGSFWILVGAATILLLGSLLVSRERLRRGVGGPQGAVDASGSS